MIRRTAAALRAPGKGQLEAGRTLKVVVTNRKISSWNMTSMRGVTLTPRSGVEPCENRDSHAEGGHHAPPDVTDGGSLPES